MTIEFTEPIGLALRKHLGGRVSERRRFEAGDSLGVEFLGEDEDLETIDFQMPDGSFAIAVPRLALSVINERPHGPDDSGFFAGPTEAGNIVPLGRRRLGKPGTV